MMKLNIKALAEQHFKAPVVVRFPTEELDKKGETVFGTARFIGRFRAVPVSEVRKQLEELQQVQDDGDSTKALELAASQMEQYFIGFEAMPGEELPFTDDSEQPLVSSPEAIKLLLNSKEVRDAVQSAWQKARNQDALAKNSRK